MKAFVTGGTGFIGSHLTDRLLTNNDYSEIRCLVRNREKWLAGKPITRISGDLMDTEALKKGLKGVDTLFHNAAILKAPDAETFQKANVDATLHLMHLAADAGVRHVAILSSLAAAGPSEGTPITESDPSRPMSMYGHSKLKMEKAIQRMAPEDMSISMIRPPVVYGPREDQILTWFKMVNRGFCPIVGDGEQPRLSVVHVNDLVDGILLSVKNNLPGVETFFMSGPEVVNWNRMRESACKILKRHPFTFYIRPTWVRRIAKVVEKGASLAGIYPVLNEEKANEMILEWTCSHKKAVEKLGYHPKISLDKGFEETLQWYKSNNWL